ncbi:MAG: RecQ family ATP-dependent DNA helicase [Planctomycetes bacterium]|nr:RecQ family ATP-dependent DNA helicase [Planctomycetota bacterium]
MPLRRILEQVRSYWGFNALRPMQEEAIQATLSGRDSVVVLPTGGGKSLCYQVPPVVADRTDIVVSPLISLMKDQVDGLRACGYPATAIHSGLSGEEKDRNARDLPTGRFRLIFVSPERLLTEAFLSFAERLNVRAFAIDEAHCISHWGHDFRPEYRKLATLKQRFPKASVHAYTATATQRVREDIAAQLHLRDPVMLVGTFDRPNLIYRVVPRLDVYSQVIEVVRRHDGEGIIVYCLSRKDTEAMADTLRNARIDARAYHAGLSAAERGRTQDAFARESLNVVTATVAFGMGIDRSNVRCVIHATMPKSIEHYQQETGRAGRDGLEAECVLFYSAADVMRWQSLIARGADGSDESERTIAAQTTLIEEMRRYCTVPKCRHRLLSEHFGQAYPRDDCEACNICLGETEGMEEATETAQKIISSVARVERISGMNFGVGHAVDVLLGADTELIRRRGHDQVSTYGILQGTPKKTLMNWVYQLLDQGLLERTVGTHPVLLLNDLSWEVMRGERTVHLIRTAARPVKKTRGAAVSWEGVDRGLFDHLRSVRRELADRDGVPAFVIFGDRTLRELARRRPTSAATFRTVQGIVDAKLTKFGDRFLREIETYCRAHELETDVTTDGAPTGSDGDVSSSTSAREGRRTGRMSRTRRVAFDLFARGASTDDVMALLARAPSTVAGYLSDFIEFARPASIERWVDGAKYQAVVRAADEVGADRLKPIFERLNKEVPYDEIRCVLAHLKVRSDSPATDPQPSGRS